MAASADLWAVAGAMRKVKLPKGIRWMSMARHEDAMIGILVRDGPEPVYGQVMVGSTQEAQAKTMKGIAALG